MEIKAIADGLEKLGREIASGLYEKYYESKTEFENIEEMKKTIQAVAEFDQWTKHPDATQSEISRRALASEDYKDFLNGLNASRSVMNEALAKVKSVESRISIYQSINKHLQYAEFNQ